MLKPALWKHAIFAPVLLVLPGCGGADKEAASQAAAYIVLGLENGGSFWHGEGQSAIVRQVSAEPLVYEVSGNKPGSGTEALKFSVNQIDDCNYAFTMENISGSDKASAPETIFSFKLDFGGLKSAARVETKRGMGSTKYATTLGGARMTCEAVGQSGDVCGFFAMNSQMVPLMAAEPDRQTLAKSLSYFQKNVCTGQSQS